MFKKPSNGPIMVRAIVSKKGLMTAANMVGALVLFAGCMHPALAQIPAGSPQPVGINGDYSEQAFVDLFSTPLIVGSNGGALTIGSDYWPGSDFEFINDNRFTFAWLSPLPSYTDPLRYSTDIGGVYSLTFNGKATLADVGNDPAHGGSTITNQTYNSVTNTTTANVNVPHVSGGVLIDLRFSNTQRTSGSAAGTGVTNVHMISPGYAANTTQVITTLFTNVVKGFAANRQMDNLGTNSYGSPSSPEVYPYRLVWPADRVQPVTATFGPLYSNVHSQGQHGYPWEYVILDSNASGVDPWINIPVNASDNYITNVAQLLKNGDAYTGNTGLNSNLHIYVEYSNEMWHYGFSQGAWNNQAAQDEVHAGGSNLNYDLTTDTERWRHRRFAKRTIEISNIFKTYFPASAIRPVINDSATGAYPDMLKYVNDNYGAPSNVLYGLSLASYINASDFSSVANTENSFIASADSQSNGYWLDQRASATFFGLKSTSYEGGEGNGGDSNSQTYSADLFATTRDAGMQNVYNRYFSDWFQAGGDLINQFTLAGNWSTYGWWGATNDLNNLTYGKWKGVAAGLTTPAPGIARGLALPTVAGQSVNSPENTTASTAYIGAGPDVWVKVLMLVTTAGTYSIVLHGTQDDVGSTESLAIDNSPRVNVSLPFWQVGDGPSSPAASFTLTPGVHALFVYVNGPARLSVLTTDQITFTLTGSPPPPPAAPTGLTATPGNTQVALSWTASTGATSYNVKRSTVSGSGYATVSSPTSTSYTNTGLTNGTTYYFVVSAVNATGESANSSQVAGTPAGGGSTKYEAENAALSGGAGVRTDHTGYSGTGFVAGYGAVGASTTFTVNMASAGNSGVTLHYSNGMGNTRTLSLYVNGVKIKQTNLPATATWDIWTDAAETVTLNSGSNTIAYKYDSTDSGNVNLDYILVGGGSAPSAPTGLTATPGNAQVALSWTASTGATSYNVKRSTLSGSGYATVSSPTGTSYTNTGLTNGTTYYFVVSAVNASGESANSSQASATPTGGSTNIARTGTGYFWNRNATSTTDNNKVAAVGINDNILNVDVDLGGGGDDIVNGWEAAGVTWSAAQGAITSVKYINGTWTAINNGAFTANFKLQTTTDGTTWTDSSWTATPGYSYDSPSAAGVTYTFTGTAISGLKGVRVTGQVNTPSSNSWRADCYEVQAFN